MKTMENLIRLGICKSCAIVIGKSWQVDNRVSGPDCFGQNAAGSSMSNETAFLLMICAKKWKPVNRYDDMLRVDNRKTFLFLSKNICFGCSKEPSHRDRKSASKC